jgi:hypothetical protein
MTTTHETIPSSDDFDPHYRVEHRDAFRDLRGRTADEIRGIVAILAAEGRLEPPVVAGMKKVQAANQKAGPFVPNTYEDVERLLVNYANRQDGSDSEKPASQLPLKRIMPSVLDVDVAGQLHAGEQPGDLPVSGPAQD